MNLPKNYNIYKISLNRIRNFLNLKNDEKIDNKPLNQFEYIKVEDLIFLYENKTILEHINMTIKKGDKIGLQGNNGCGKSTLANILSKIEINYKGKIMYNDIDYKDISSTSLREKIIYIPSDGYIFNDTIMNNIFMKSNNQDISYDYLKNNDLCNILIKNNIDLNMVIDNKNNKLSGGEKKLVQILRSTFISGDIYIFDEPLNYIDSKYKKDLINFIKTKLVDKTVIIISHDESIFECCDKMYRFKDKHLELIK